MVGRQLFVKALFLGLPKEYSQRQRVRLHRAGEGLQAVVRLVVLFKVISMLLEPFVVVGLVEGDTDLKQVDQGKALVLQGRFDYLFGLVRVGGVGPGDEAAAVAEQGGQRIEGFQQYAGGLNRGLEAFA